MLNKFVKLNLLNFLNLGSNLVTPVTITLITMMLYTNPLFTANGVCRPSCVNTVGETCCEARPCCTSQGLTCQYGLCISSTPITPPVAVTCPSTDSNVCCIENDNNGNCPTGTTCLAGACQQVTNQQIFQTYYNLNKSLYVWNAAPPTAHIGVDIWQALLQNESVTNNGNGAADNLIQFCVAHNFQRIYLYIGATQYDWDQSCPANWTGASYQAGSLPYEKGLSYIIGQANKHNIEVYGLYYLNDDYNKIYIDQNNAVKFGCTSMPPVAQQKPPCSQTPPDDIHKITDLVNAVIGYNKRNPTTQFAGIMGDQEPVADTSFCNYLALNQTIKSIIANSSQPTLKTAVSIKPEWTTTPFSYSYNGVSYNQPLYQSILPLVDIPVIMAYSSSPFVSSTGSSPLAIDFQKANCTSSSTYYLYADPLVNTVTSAKPQTQTPEIAVETGSLNTDNSPCISYGDTIISTQPNTDQSPSVTKFYSYLTNIAARYPYPTATLAVHDFAQYFTELYNSDPYSCSGTPGCTFKTTALSAKTSSKTNSKP